MKTLLRSYSNHMSAHPGQFCETPCNSFSIRANGWNADATVNGIAWAQISPEGHMKCYPYMTKSELTSAIAAIGADAHRQIADAVESLRLARDINREARKAHEVKLQSWVDTRMALLEELRTKCSNIPTEWVRQGKVAPGHKSFNFRDGFTEVGCSVFPAKRIGSKLYILDVFASSLWFSPDYLCIGEQIGTGSDGEPLIHVTDCKKARKGEIVML